jgi:hypothetical protein
MSTGNAEEITRLNRYTIIVNSGQATLKALMTLNGGATIAFLAFMGHLWEKGGPSANLHVLLGALPYLIGGTFCTVLGYGLIFLTGCCSFVGWYRASNFLFLSAVLACFASIAFFLFASLRAMNAFEFLTQSRTAMLYF